MNTMKLSAKAYRTELSRLEGMKKEADEAYHAAQTIHTHVSDRPKLAALYQAAHAAHVALAEFVREHGKGRRK